MAGIIETKKRHPRVALSGLCFPALSAVEAMAETGDLGVTKTSMTSAKLREAGPAAVRAASRDRGVEVVTTTALVRFDLSAGADVGAQAQRARDLVSYAAEKDLTIAVEPTNWLYADLTFIHSFRDAVEFCSRSGLKVCLDLFHVWTESDLRPAIEEHVHLISHVQLSDMERGARALPCRAVPGDGDVPIRAVVQWLLEAGYAGVFDLELSGPGIDAVGHRAAALRSASWLDDLLVELAP